MREYRAFISYRHLPRDMAVARRLHRIIEHYRVPAEYADRFPNRRLGYVFRDQDELPLSSDLGGDICDALDRSDFLIVICTPETPKSKWVEREIRYFLERHDHNHILAVLADGRPEQSFPPLLVHVPDGAGNVVDTEPLAANIAAPSTGGALRRLDREALRLIAALIGCPYDALYQRERRYRARRRALAVGAVAAVALAYIAMLTVKNQQITRQNRQLIEQKRVIQTDESRLLTDEARRALEQGERAEAMRCALRALPRGPEDDRPFYAPAEGVLLEASGALEDEKAGATLLEAVTLELVAPVHAMAFDDGGGRLLAVDDYGCLGAFDSATGQRLWQVQVTALARKAPEFLELRIDDASGAVIAASDSAVSCYALEDGALRWRYAGDSVIEDQLALDAASDRLAFVERNHIGWSEVGSLVCDYELVALRAGDGGEVARVPLERGAELLSYLTERGAYSAEQTQNALLLDGGRRFAGFRYAGLDMLVCFVCDLETGACRKLREDPVDADPALWIEAAPDGESLLLFRRDADKSCAAVVRRISLEDGEALQEFRTPAEESELFSYNAEFHVLSGGFVLLFSAGNHLYALDPASGECVASVGLHDTLTSMRWVSNTVFGFTLGSGYYADGWLNGDRLFRDSNSFSLTFSLGKNAASAIGGNGLMLPVVEGSSLQGFSCGAPDEGFGYAAIVPEGDSRRLRLWRLLPRLEMEAPLKSGFPDDGAFMMEDNYSRALRLIPGRAILRQYHGKEGEYSLALLDTRTGELSRLPRYKAESLACEYPFSDGSGMFLIDERQGVVRRLDFSDGSIVAVADEETVEVTSNGHISFVCSTAAASSAYLADGRLLTARCDGKALRWWLDGEEQPPVPLPDDLTWQTARGTVFRRLLMAAPSGFVMLSDYAAEGGTMAGFVACDMASRSWLRAEDLAQDTEERDFAAGEARPLLASVDPDGSLRVYDLAAGSLLREIAVNLPMDYISAVRFMLDDRYLLLRMADSRLAIYSVDTGECVFRGELKLSGYSTTRTEAGSDGNRAILIDVDGHEGLIVDMDTWTELARLKDVWGFDSERGELYTCSLRELTRRRLPGQWELIEAASRTLGTEQE